MKITEGKPPVTKADRIKSLATGHCLIFHGKECNKDFQRNLLAIAHYYFKDKRKFKTSRKEGVIKMWRVK